MNKRSKNKGLLLLLMMIFLSLLIFLGGVMFFDYQKNTLVDDFIDFSANQQEKQLDIIISNIKSFEDESEIVSLLDSLKSSSSYYFLYNSRNVVFEKNEETTKTLKLVGPDEISSYYSRKGAVGIDSLIQNINNKIDSSQVVIKDKNVGKEIITIKKISFNDNEYMLGLSTKESYVLSKGKISEHLVKMRVLTYGLCVIIIMSVSFFSIMLFRYKIKINNLQIEINDKNLIVQEQGERIFESRRVLSNQGVDTLTGLYDKSFLDIIISKLTEKKVNDVQILLIKIENINEIILTNKYTFVNQLFKKIAGVLKVYCSVDDICTRVDNDLFCIVRVKRDDKAINLSRLTDLITDEVQGIKIRRIQTTSTETLTVKEVYDDAMQKINNNQYLIVVK